MKLSVTVAIIAFAHPLSFGDATSLRGRLGSRAGVIAEHVGKVDFEVVNKSSIEQKETADCLCKEGQFWHWRIKQCIDQGHWGYECGFFPAEHHRFVCSPGLFCKKLVGTEVTYQHKGAVPASCDYCSKAPEGTHCTDRNHDDECLKETTLSGEARATVIVTVTVDATAHATKGHSAEATSMHIIASEATGNNGQVQATNKAQSNFTANATYTAWANADATAQAEAIGKGSAVVSIDEVKKAMKLAKEQKVGPVLASRVISKGDEMAFDLAYERALKDAQSKADVLAKEEAERLAAEKAAADAKMDSEAKAAEKAAWEAEGGAKKAAEKGQGSLQKAADAAAKATSDAAKAASDIFGAGGDAASDAAGATSDAASDAAKTASDAAKADEDKLPWEDAKGDTDKKGEKGQEGKAGEGKEGEAGKAAGGETGEGGAKNGKAEEAAKSGDAAGADGTGGAAGTGGATGTDGAAGTGEAAGTGGAAKADNAKTGEAAKKEEAKGKDAAKGEGEAPATMQKEKKAAKNNKGPKPPRKVTKEENDAELP